MVFERVFMDIFSYCDGELFVEGVVFFCIVECFGMFIYVYFCVYIEVQYCVYVDVFVGMLYLVCFVVKVNFNFGVLNVLVCFGVGFDIVFCGELECVLVVGGDLVKVVFFGVGKICDDMCCVLEVGVYCFNVEFGEELECL